MLEHSCQHPTGHQVVFEGDAVVFAALHAAEHADDIEQDDQWSRAAGDLQRILAIAGDAVDNIRGIGIGRKAAAKLLREFGSLDALLKGLDQVKLPKTRDKLETAREQIVQNRKMVELDCRLPLPAPIEDLRITPDYPRLIQSLEECEFKSLLQEVRDEATRAEKQTQGELLL